MSVPSIQHAVVPSPISEKTSPGQHPRISGALPSSQVMASSVSTTVSVSYDGDATNISCWDDDTEYDGFLANTSSSDSTIFGVSVTVGVGVGATVEIAFTVTAGTGTGAGSSTKGAGVATTGSGSGSTATGSGSGSVTGAATVGSGSTTTGSGSASTTTGRGASTGADGAVFSSTNGVVATSVAVGVAGVSTTFSLGTTAVKFGTVLVVERC